MSSDLDTIAIGDRQGFMPIHTDHRFMLGVHGDTDRSAFGQYNRPVHGKVRCDGHQKDVPQFGGQDRPAGCQGIRR